MPELPEAHTIAQGLNEALCGKTLKAVQILDGTALTGHGSTEPVFGFEDFLGRKILSVSRRGKGILFSMQGVSRAILVQLGMTGQVLLQDSPGHCRARFLTEEGPAAHYLDTRRLGRVRLVSPETEEAVDALSPEFTPEYLACVLSHRTAKIKALLLDQKLVAGLGNIYATEALFRARIRPKRSGGSLKKREVLALHRAIRKSLQAGIRWRGASIANYVDAHGDKGEVQRHFLAYARQGKPCRRCGDILKRVVVAARGSVFCPGCQK